MVKSIRQPKQYKGGKRGIKDYFLLSTVGKKRWKCRREEESLGSVFWGSCGEKTEE